ncbi:MAG: FecR domain-containing protein [Anaerolineae bacterium]|nr:FecR domain-containing protein [Anaerolineae bacterium]
MDILVAGSSTWQPVEVDTQIEAGDRIRTGSDSAVQLAFFDGSTTDLAPETEVSIVQMSSRKSGGGKVVVLQQWSGQTYHRVQPLLDAESRFEVETPSAVASVRGTEFALDVGADGTTLVIVVEGLVNVEAQEVTIAVEAGHGMVARPQQPPEPAGPASTLPAQVELPGLPGQTKTPQPPGQTKTPQPPGQTKTPQPPGQTKTPQPPGQTKTPQPPGQDKTPKPKPPKPPKKPKK